MYDTFLVHTHYIVHRHLNRLSRMSSLHIHTMSLLCAITWEAPWNRMEGARACMPIDGMARILLTMWSGVCCHHCAVIIRGSWNICTTFSHDLQHRRLQESFLWFSITISFFKDVFKSHFKELYQVYRIHLEKQSLCSVSHYVSEWSLLLNPLVLKKYFLWFIFFKIIFGMYVYTVFCVSHFQLRVLVLQMIVIALYLLLGLWRFVLCSLGLHSKCFEPLTCLWVVPIFISCLPTPELSVWI